MALIKCPYCDSEISDKATKCPKCGNELSDSKGLSEICEECGKEIPRNATECPYCGCPRNDSPQKVEVTAVSMSKPNKKIIIIALVAVVVICIGVFIANSIRDKQEQIKAEQVAAMEKEAADTYKENLVAIKAKMLTGGAEAEYACGLIHDVWYNTIYEEDDYTTNKFCKNGSFFNSDFNISLRNLFADSDFKARISGIEFNQDEVKELMRELTNPPEESKGAYDAVKELYDAYLEITELAVNPGGNLTSYTSNFNEADSNFMKYYQALDIYID